MKRKDGKRFRETVFSKGETKYRKMVNSQKIGVLPIGEKEKKTWQERKKYKWMKDWDKSKIKYTLQWGKKKDVSVSRLWCIFAGKQDKNKKNNFIFCFSFLNCTVLCYH